MVKDSVSLSVVTDRLKANIEVKHHKDRHFTINKMYSFFFTFIRREEQCRSGSRDGLTTLHGRLNFLYFLNDSHKKSCVWFICIETVLHLPSK